MQSESDLKRSISVGEIKILFVPPARQPPQVISLEFSDFLSATVNMEITFRLVPVSPERATAATLNSVLQRVLRETFLA